MVYRVIKIVCYNNGKYKYFNNWEELIMSRPNKLLESGKYTELVREAIDRYWAENYIPPTIEQLMEMTGCPSRSHVSKILRVLPDIVMVNHHPVPKWIIDRISNG